MYQEQPNIFIRILNKLINSRIFPSDSKPKILLGLWWIIEPFLIELPIAQALLPTYYWEILGPINIGLFISTMFAVIYGSLCFGAGYVQWMNERAKKKPI